MPCNEALCDGYEGLTWGHRTMGPKGPGKGDLMEWLVGFAGLWVLFQWIIPIALLLLVAVVAMRWAQGRNRPEATTFSSALPEDRDRVRERDHQDRYWPLEPGAASDEEAHLHVHRRRE